jgi:hypothetical protein
MRCDAIRTGNSLFAISACGKEPSRKSRTGSAFRYDAAASIMRRGWQIGWPYCVAYTSHRADHRSQKNEPVSGFLRQTLYQRKSCSKEAEYEEDAFYPGIDPGCRCTCPGGCGILFDAGRRH